MDDTRKRCTYCGGTGRRTETSTESDHAMGFALGAAFGTGYFPSTKTVTRRVNCSYCHGTGKR